MPRTTTPHLSHSRMLDIIEQVAEMGRREHFRYREVHFLTIDQDPKIEVKITTDDGRHWIARTEPMADDRLGQFIEVDD